MSKVKDARRLPLLQSHPRLHIKGFQTRIVSTATEMYSAQEPGLKILEILIHDGCRSFKHRSKEWPEGLPLYTTSLLPMLLPFPPHLSHCIKTLVL